ncbi:MAG: DUF975 family protein [Tissierellia bacterium]|jgi:uncharacterized membrane protein|nr:DUF975 family protein [Tissierellia bacterium]
MWDRAELKTKAKEVLKEKYWKSFLISLVLLLSGADGSGGSSGRDAGEKVSEWVDFSEYIIIIVAFVILVIAYRILIGYSLEIGSRKFFIQSAQYKKDAGCYSFAFASENFRGIISTMLLKDIYVFLWSLLLIIPGIIKSYAYRMVPYILADNPNLGADNAITLSSKMMDGNKFDLFVLQLSFLGWYLLGLLALGVGILFVNPYYNAAEAQLYLVLRKTAIDLGYCTNEDLALDNDYIRHDDYYWEE